MLTFYNTSFTPQTVSAGTVVTGAHGSQIITDEPVTVAADNPPVNGQANVEAHALDAGAQGNIPVLAINAIFSSTLYAKNLVAFTGGQDAKDFRVVTQADITSASVPLKVKVSANMTAALKGQLMPGQALQPTPCTPTMTTDHHAGDAAATVQVAVAESCTAIAYDTMALQTQAMQLLTVQAAKTLGTGYTRYGNITATVTKAIMQQHSVLLSFTCQGIWVYQINEAQLQALVSGKPRLEALQLLAQLPGIQRASISGIADNQPLPDDVTHIHLLIVLTCFLYTLCS